MGDKATIPKEMERRSMMASKMYQEANLDSLPRREEGLASPTNPKTEITSRYLPSRSVRELHDLTTSAFKKSENVSNNRLAGEQKYTIPAAMNKEVCQPSRDPPLKKLNVVNNTQVNSRKKTSSLIKNRIKQSASTDNMPEPQDNRPRSRATYRSASQSATETVDVKFCTIPNKAFQDYMKKHSSRDNVADRKVYRTIMLSGGNPIDSLSNLSKVQENFQRSMKNAALKAIPSVPSKQSNGQQRKYMCYKMPQFEAGQNNSSIIK